MPAQVIRKSGKLVVISARFSGVSVKPLVATVRMAEQIALDGMQNVCGISYWFLFSKEIWVWYVEMCNLLCLIVIQFCNCA